MGLETEPGPIQSDPTDVWPPGDRPICIQNLQAASPILQLETRPRCRSHRCLQTGLEREQLCQPSMGHHSTSSVTREDAENQHRPHSTSMEVPGMVPCSPEPTCGLPMSATNQRLNDPAAPHSPLASPRPPSATGRMAHIRRSCEERQFSKEATGLLMASWRSKSQSNYNSLFLKWERWCCERSRNPIQGPVSDVINFLAELYAAGYSYRSLNSYRSAISSAHEKVDGHLVGQHPTVTRILKGAFNSRLPKPRYTSTWSVSQVVNWLDQQDNSKMPLLTLSMKTVTLCALSRPCRSAELANLSLQSLVFSSEGASASPLTPPKQCQPGRAIKEYFFSRFDDNTNTCPVATLRQYCNRTKKLRSTEKGRENVFLTSTNPHGPATSATIARWIKTVLAKAGIDTTIFKAHSIRAASTSAAAEAGVSIPEILEAADWSNQSTFERFYFRPCKSSSFGTTVLKCASKLQS